jgi:hypothetical protein
MNEHLKKIQRKLKPQEGGGASILGFGIDRPVSGTSQQELVIDLVVWLEGRRALSAIYEMEGEWYVNQGILSIREHLDDVLPTLDHRDEAWSIVRDWRDRCNQHLGAVPDPRHSSNGLGPKAANALKAIRGSFGLGLLTLADGYDVPEVGDLAHKIASGTNW